MTTVAVGTDPRSIAVNPVTNKIYVANVGSDNVTVIDGTNNTPTNITVGGAPRAIAVNPATNRIYVANNASGDNTVTVINGIDNSTTPVAVGMRPISVAVNPVTNKIYTANNAGNDVTVIDGANNTIAATVAAGTSPTAVAVNPVTNKIYVVNFGSTDVTVIDGTSNTPTALNIGTFNDRNILVNPATNKIYIPNPVFNTVKVIDGTNNSITTVTAGSGPLNGGVNPVTGKVYVANNGSANVTVITPAPTNAIPLNTTVTPFAGNTTTNPISTLTLTATSTYSPNTPPPQNIYFQTDTANGMWTKATNTGSTATTLTADATTPTLQPGIHTLYFFATDGSEATSINPAIPPEIKIKNGFDDLAPESSPVIGGINAYVFLVIPPGTTAASVTVGGRVFSPTGRGLARARVVITNSDGTTRTAITNSFGYYRFNQVEVGQTYIVSVRSKQYRFDPQVLTVTDELTNLNFTALSK